jgi:hypothetical protein
VEQRAPSWRTPRQDRLRDWRFDDFELAIYEYDAVMKKRAGRPPLFEVRHSPIHGYGVFALRRIRKGTTVTEYLGDRVTHAEADARYEDKDPADNHTFLFTVDSRTVIDGGVGGNDARFINHGCDPNCESTRQDKRIFVEAIRTIQPGEELAYDYQIERDPDDPPNVDAIFACRCGAAKCRGSMLVAPKSPRRKARSAARAAATAKPVKKPAKKPKKKARVAGPAIESRRKILRRDSARRSKPVLAGRARSTAITRRTNAAKRGGVAR